MANPIILEGEWLAARHAAARLGITTARFYELVREGRLAYQETPIGRLYSATAVDALRAELDATPQYQGYSRQASQS